MSIKCNICQYDNKDGSSYCVKCGSLLDGQEREVVIKSKNKEIEDNLAKLKGEKEHLNLLVQELIQDKNNIEAFGLFKISCSRHILQLRGKSKRCNELKESAKNKIEAMTYNKDLSLEDNKEALNRIIENLKIDLSKVGVWDNAKQWTIDNWKWSVGILLFVIFALLLMNVWGGDDTLKVPLSETTPSLESNTWKISKMDGINVNESAEVYSVDGSNSHYGMRHITENGREISVTFNVDWQLETVSSPELGEGKIERDDKLNELKLIFEKWTLKRYY